MKWNDVTGRTTGINNRNWQKPSDETTDKQNLRMWNWLRRDRNRLTNASAQRGIRTEHRAISIATESNVCIFYARSAGHMFIPAHTPLLTFTHNARTHRRQRTEIPCKECIIEYAHAHTPTAEVSVSAAQCALFVYETENGLSKCPTHST